MAVVPAKAKPRVEEPSKGAGWLLSGLTLLATVPALVGIGTGDLPQMVRNHPIWSLLAIVCVVLGVGCGFLAGYVFTNPSTEKDLLKAGLVLVSVGLIAIAVAGVRTWRDQPEPTVSAQPTLAPTGTKLTIGVKANGIKAKDDLTVLVQPLTRRRTASGTRLEIRPPLLGASLGATRTGDVDYSTDVTVPPGDFTDIEVRAWVGERPKHCYTEGSKSGCVTVALVRAPERPQLSVDWKDPADRRKGLIVKTSARDIPGNALALRVQGRVGKAVRTIASANLAPDALGSVDRSLTVPIDQSFSSVCVVASTTQAEPRCPPSPANPTTAWASLRAPRVQGG